MVNTWISAFSLLTRKYVPASQSASCIPKAEDGLHNCRLQQKYIACTLPQNFHEMLEFSLQKAFRKPIEMNLVWYCPSLNLECPDYSGRKWTNLQAGFTSKTIQHCPLFARKYEGDWTIAEAKSYLWLRTSLPVKSKAEAVRCAAKLTNRKRSLQTECFTDCCYHNNCFITAEKECYSPKKCMESRQGIYWPNSK